MQLTKPSAITKSRIRDPYTSGMWKLFFRPINLLLILLTLIAFEGGILILKHHQASTFSSQTDHHLRHPHHFHGGSKHIRGSEAPRIAIVTILSKKNTPNALNFKNYAKKWGYDLIDASQSVQSASATLRKSGADTTFLRVFAILRFLPQYDWVFWNDPDSFFLNFSRAIDEFVDVKYDMVLTAAPCDSKESATLLNAGHMLIKNSRSSINTLRSVWGLWNHSSCK